MATKKAAATTKKNEEDKGDIRPTPADWEALKPVSSYDDYDRIKALLTGRTKAGKSHCAARFKKPLVGLTEMQAIPTYKRSNPNAVIFPITGPKELFKFKLMAKEAHLHGFDAVVADSLTDMQRILRAYYTKRQGEKAGKEKTSQESWGLIVDATAKLARDLRDLPVHVLAICIDEEQVVDGEIVHRPGVSGKRLPNDLCQYFNVVGHVQMKEQERGFRHEVLFRADDRYLVGAPSWLDNVMPPEPLLWISRMTGAKVPPEVQERVDAWERMVLPDGVGGDDDDKKRDGSDDESDDAGSDD